jgi:hypothetical protein
MPALMMPSGSAVTQYRMSGEPRRALQDTGTASVRNAGQLSRAALRRSISPLHMSTTTLPARATMATIAIITIIAASTSSPSSEALRHEQEGQRGIDGAITTDHRPVILTHVNCIGPLRWQSEASPPKWPGHVGRDLARPLLVKPVPGCELETAIGPSQRSLETRMEKAVGFDHDHASSTAVRMAISQPEELRGRLRFLCHAAASLGSTG